MAWMIGWNAVWLEVQPEADDSETVFSGLPLASEASADPEWNERRIQLRAGRATLVGADVGEREHRTRDGPRAARG